MRYINVTLRKLVLVLGLGLLVLARPAQAQIVWNWGFGSNAGTFTTNGTAPGGVAAAGTYTFSDFLVTASGSGAPLGSVSGGQYIAGGFGSALPRAPRAEPNPRQDSRTS